MLIQKQYNKSRYTQMIFIIEKAKEIVLNFSKGTIKVL